MATHTTLARPRTTIAQRAARLSMGSTLLFLVLLACACVTLFIAMRPHIVTRAGKIGLGFLVATAVGLAMAAAFPIDPIIAPPGAGTVHGMLHGVATIIGLPSLPIAALLLSRGLLRNPAWETAKRGLLITAHATWVSLAVMIALLAVQLPHAGGFGPTVWVGWTNRLVMVVYSGWLLTAAWYALQMSRPRS